MSIWIISGYGEYTQRVFTLGCLIVRRSSVNTLQDAFETDCCLIAQTTSGGGLRRIPEVTWPSVRASISSKLHSCNLYSSLSEVHHEEVVLSAHTRWIDYRIRLLMLVIICILCTCTGVWSSLAKGASVEDTLVEELKTRWTPEHEGERVS